jgi:hypothetical protein
MDHMKEGLYQKDKINSTRRINPPITVNLTKSDYIIYGKVKSARKYTRAFARARARVV